MSLVIPDVIEEGCTTRQAIERDRAIADAVPGPTPRWPNPPDP